MNFYKKIIQEEVSIYETCEHDIGAPDIHRFPRVDGLSTGPLGLGRHKLSILFSSNLLVFLTNCSRIWFNFLLSSTKFIFFNYLFFYIV